MAEIRFTGFVDEWTKTNPQHPHWGMRVVETHRKPEGDKWVTVARTYRTVKAGYEVDIDFTKFTKDDMVTIEGKEVTETTEVDGKKYHKLVVKADKVTLNATITSGSAGPDYSQQVTPAFVDDNPPF